jgi:syntaxin 7
MLGGRVNYNHLEEGANGATGQEHKESMLTDQDIDIDYELERKIMLEKNEIINEVEQSTLRINEIMNDMGIMVDDQGEQLDVISEELMKTNKNMSDANENLEEANTLQKKARKKYILLVTLLILIILVVAGVIFFLVG